jgi:hypothetical protein
MPGGYCIVDIQHQMAELEIYIEDLEDIIRSSQNPQEVQDARERRAIAMEQHNQLYELEQ